jgi:RNA polymerase sigma-70 factor, ECF subfamily
VAERDVEAAALVDAFVAGMRARGLAADDPAWRDWLPELWQRVQRRWSITPRPGRLGAALAERVQAGERPVDLERSIQLDDLALAVACADGDTHAIEALERNYGRHLEQVMASVNDPRLGPDDKRQIVRVALFVASAERPPAIGQYGGRGSFVAWLRVTAKRTLLNAVRRHEPERATADDDAILDAVAAGAPDAELQILGASYRDAFREAIRRSLGELSLRERTLLRQVTAGGMSVRDLARVYDVHHATTARWLRQAYDELQVRIKAHLAVVLHSDDRGVESVLSLIRSRLDASFAGLVAPGERE